MNNTELVSIITPTYNCGRFIMETIKSVMSQTYTNWEMIVVDDCSTDDTYQILSKIRDPRIIYHRMSKNSGAAIARNQALKLAKGKWIAFLDSDDMWLPDKLQHQIDFMNKHGFKFSYHNYIEIDESGNPLNILVSGKKHINKFDMFACCWPGCLSVMYDAEKVGVIQIEDIKKNNDTAIWLKVIKKCNCHLLDENLAVYRRRKGSITPTKTIDKIFHHYPLFRHAEKMNAPTAAFWMCVNVIGNSIKKLFYVKKYHNTI